MKNYTFPKDTCTCIDGLQIDNWAECQKVPWYSGCHLCNFFIGGGLAVSRWWRLGKRKKNKGMEEGYKEKRARMQRLSLNEWIRVYWEGNKYHISVWTLNKKTRGQGKKWNWSQAFNNYILNSLSLLDSKYWLCSHFDSRHQKVMYSKY